jgi:hypothetical protein
VQLGRSAHSRSHSLLGAGVSQAQSAGTVTTHFPPGVISLVLHLATLWVEIDPDVTEGVHRRTQTHVKASSDKP